MGTATHMHAYFLCTLYNRATLSTPEICVHICGTMRGPKMNGEDF